MKGIGGGIRLLRSGFPLLFLAGYFDTRFFTTRGLNRWARSGNTSSTHSLSNRSIETPNVSVEIC
jgi:hypothetical protein